MSGQNRYVDYHVRNPSDIMILNRYLSQKMLVKTLTKKDFYNIEFILQNLTPSDKIPRSIYENDKLLGQIHFAKNMGKYTSKKFRLELYNRSRKTITETWQEYFRICGVKKKVSNIDNIDSKIINKYVTFDWDKNLETERFVKFFGYPDYMIPDGRKDIETSIDVFGGKSDFEPLKTLLDYQSIIVSKTMKEMKHENAYRLIQMPTGTGKTRVAMEIVARILNKTPDIQIVWFANKSELLAQAHESFKHIWNHVGEFSVKAIVAWGTKTIPKIPSKRVIVFASYQKINNFLKSNSSLKPDYIIIDEAHQILAPTYEKALYDLADKNHSRVLGLTATPGRGIDDKQNKKLAKIFHKKIIEIDLYGEDANLFEKNIIKYLEFEEILAKAKLEPLHTNAEYALTKTEIKNLTKIIQGDRPELTEKLLEKLANDNIRNILIIKRLQELANEGKKILYFSTSKSQSILVFITLQQLGINAIHVDGDTNHSFRRQIVRKFVNTNKIQVICNYDIFSTGFDVPKLEVVFIGRPVMSPVLYNQIVGRGTRGLAMNGKKTFTLVQVIDQFRMKSIKFDPYEHYRYWDGSWNS